MQTASLSLIDCDPAPGAIVSDRRAESPSHVDRRREFFSTGQLPFRVWRSDK
jgi:hypothetical protein